MFLYFLAFSFIIMYFNVFMLKSLVVNHKMVKIENYLFETGSPYYAGKCVGLEGQVSQYRMIRSTTTARSV